MTETTTDTADSFLSWSPFGTERLHKRRLLGKQLAELTELHRDHCPAYRSFLKSYRTETVNSSELEEIPYFPVRLFKTLELRSVPTEDVVTTLSSSGTTGQAVSRIFLDRLTSSFQTKTLVRVMQEFIGLKRLPMLIIDHPGVIRDRQSFSARGAGILGFKNFGRDHVYALRDGDMSCDIELIEDFLRRNHEGPILLFGFTFMVWKYFIRGLESAKKTLKFPPSILIHGGGWKKLHEESVTNSTFKERLRSVTGISGVHNFSGMVEQVGAIHVECEAGYLHAPAFSDVIVREPGTWRPLAAGEMGVIQVLSALPRSYPGHSLLTEDLGVLHGEDNCTCGRLGKYFSVLGRVPQAELRGCGDTHAFGATP